MSTTIDHPVLLADVGAGDSSVSRLHWLGEQVMNWSSVPTVHVRPAVFLDHPLCTLLARQSISENDLLAIPFGTGRTSPVAAYDVARVAVAILRNPAQHVVQHILTLVALHRADRYDRLTDDVERLTGRPAESAEHFVGRHRHAFTAPATPG